MNAAHYQRLFDYNTWAHRRVWSCVLKLTDEQLHQPSDYSIGSIYDQLVHTMGAEWLWLSRMQGVSPDYIPGAAEFPTLEALRTEWDKVDAGWRAYVAGLTDAQLDEMMEYVSINGRARRTTPRWEALSQILNHSTDHRAQTLALIHQVGGETVEQDFVFYCWEYPTA
jgi:uncharacterized damage-inducible protein DinB